MPDGNKSQILSQLDRGFFYCGAILQFEGSDLESALSRVFRLFKILKLLAIQGTVGFVQEDWSTI